MSSSTISLTDLNTCWQDPKAKSIGFFSVGPVTTVDEKLIQEMKDLALKSGENVRLSLHQDPKAAFHEMIIVQHRDKFHPPKKHVQKAKSFHIMEGKMAVFSFTETGDVTHSVVLDRNGSTIFRIEKEVYHVDIPVSGLIVHHESTLGPFLGDDDGIYAEWCPGMDGLLAYRDQLFAQCSIEDA
jgi:cupin fold WbuC family metalloprotein